MPQNLDAPATVAPAGLDGICRKRYLHAMDAIDVHDTSGYSADSTGAVAN